MERVNIPPETDGELIAGLISVRTGGRTLLGVKNQAATKKGKGHNFFVLDRALELIVQHGQTKEGVQTNIIPVPISPATGPCTVNVWADFFLDLSRDKDMGAFYRQYTGASGIILPKFG